LKLTTAFSAHYDTENITLKINVTILAAP